MPPATKAAPRKRAAARATAVPAEPSEQPLVHLTPRSEVEPRKILLFHLDDVDYYVPEVGEAWMAVEYMALLDEHGEAKAEAFMLRALIGNEGYEALRGYKQLTIDDLAALVNACQQIILGGAGRPKARRPRR